MEKGGEMIESDGTVEFICGVCGLKTQEQREMYYIEKEESETHADMIVCSTCFQELVKCVKEHVAGCLVTRT